MATAENLTGLLAVAFGAYALAAGLGGFMAPFRWKRLLRELELSPTLQFLAGIITFALGVTIMCVQPMGPGVLAVVVALIGWAAIAEGLLLLAMPPVILGLARVFMGNGARAYAAISVLIGLLFVIAGIMDINAA